MTRIGLQDMTVEQLVQLFITIALDQDKAIMTNDNAKYNRLYSQMDDVKNELKRRADDQRRALIELYDHPNVQVRLKAAITTLGLAPEAARRVLQIISDRAEFPQAADANGILRALDNGTFVPN
ncbi:MAG: DUF2019 domain-containing protein [Rhizobiales bacterium]|nr:DUF2019 domain-containing protein [Hyphomicrobiales bacterium]